MADAPHVPDHNSPDPQQGAAFPTNDEAPVSAEAFAAAFGESLEQTLDLSTWRLGADLGQEYERMKKEVHEAVAQETHLEQRIRDELFPFLRERPRAPKNAGVHAVEPEIIQLIHERLLFHGGVEACDGHLRVHDTLPLTIYQVGVGLVSYQGERGTWRQRLFRRDLHQRGNDPVAEALAILQGRQRRDGEQPDPLGAMARKVLLDYAERAILLHHSTAPWRMGHGNPISYELMTGGSNPELMVAATNVLRGLIEKHQKFVFVGEARDRMLLTLAQALPPWHYAIVGTLDERLKGWFQQKRFAVDAGRKLRWDDTLMPAAEWIPRLISEVASQVVVGLVRSARVAPAHVFYAHVDHADYAAHVVLADCTLQEHRGSPLLADLAKHLCDSVFGDILDGLADSAYAAAGTAWRYPRA